MVLSYVKMNKAGFGAVGVCVCVTLGIIGILFGFVRFAFPVCVTAGGLVVHASTSPTKRLALNTDIGGDAHRRTCSLRKFELSCKGLMQLQSRTERRHFVGSASPCALGHTSF